MGEHFKRAQDLTVGDVFRLDVRAHVIGVQHTGAATRVKCQIEITDAGFAATPDDGPLELTFCIPDVGCRQ